MSATTAAATRTGSRATTIPLIARIVTVCDAYDAMVTDRAYRAACDRSEAIAELRRCSGTQFDPQVVEALISVLDAAGELAHIESQHA